MDMKPGTEPESACRADLEDTPVTTAWLWSPAWDSIFPVASLFPEGALGDLCNSWAGSSDWWCLLRSYAFVPTAREARKASLVFSLSL